jgi:hypothetical protein
MNKKQNTNNDRNEEREDGNTADCSTTSWHRVAELKTKTKCKRDRQNEKKMRYSDNRILPPKNKRMLFPESS